MTDDAPQSAAGQEGQPVDVRRAGGPLGLGCLGAVCLVLLLLCTVSGVLNLALLSSAPQPTTGPSWTEEIITRGGSDRVLVLEVSGVLTDQAGPGVLGRTRESPVERLASQLERARTDGVAAVVLSIDSPGGAVRASDRMWKEVRDYRQETGRPVVVSMGTVCASGGYYVASAADHLVAEPTTLTGSIGVLLQTLHFAGLMEQIGVEDTTVGSGEAKDFLNPLDPPAEEDRERANQLVSWFHDRFVDVVARGRPDLGREGVEPLATGGIYTADEAKENGLIDQIGYREDAIDEAASLASVQNPTVIEYGRPPGLLDILAGRGASTGGGGVTVRLDPETIDRLRTPRHLYLWQR